MNAKILLSVPKALANLLNILKKRKKTKWGGGPPLGTICWKCNPGNTPERPLLSRPAVPRGQARKGGFILQ